MAQRFELGGGFDIGSADTERDHRVGQQLDGLFDAAGLDRVTERGALIVELAL